MNKKRRSQEPEIADFEVVNRLSFWKLFELRRQLGLRRWAVELKRQTLECGREEQRLDHQMQALSGVRLWPSVLGSNTAVPLALPAPIEPEVTSDQIERIAQKAVKRLSSEQEWEEWRAGVRGKLPSYAASEVIQRADEIRGLLDEDGGKWEDESEWDDN